MARVPREGFLGPVYLENNSITVCRQLAEALGEDVAEVPNAYWYPPSVPLWGANGTDLDKFVKRFEKELNGSSDVKSNLVTFFNIQDSSEVRGVKKSFNARLPHGVSLQGGVPQDRVEILVVPGLLAIAQYHVQPNSNSSITVPIGQVTTEPDRIEKIEKLLQFRTQTSMAGEVLWSTGGANKSGLIEDKFLGFESNLGGHDDRLSKERKKDTLIMWKPSRS